MDTFNPYECGIPIVLIECPEFIKKLKTRKELKTMNVDTGELFRMNSMMTPEMVDAFTKKVEDEKEHPFEEFKSRLAEERRIASQMESGEIQIVPEELSNEAELALGNNDRVTIDMDSDNPLAKWAREARKNLTKSKKDFVKSKKSKKTAKESRKKNRKK